VSEQSGDPSLVLLRVVSQLGTLGLLYRNFET
jgi:hypothetical protein